jgi:hypothetical protein
LAHVALNRALGDLDTELEQLTANALGCGAQLFRPPSSQAGGPVIALVDFLSPALGSLLRICCSGSNWSSSGGLRSVGASGHGNAASSPPLPFDGRHSGTPSWS